MEIALVVVLKLTDMTLGVDIAVLASLVEVKPMDVTPDDVSLVKLGDGVNFTEEVSSEIIASVVETYERTLGVKVSELCMDSSPKKIEKYNSYIKVKDCS